LDIIIVGFTITDKLVIWFFKFITYWEKKFGIQWYSTSSIHKLQERLWCS
jgi:hypothetical protein